MRSRYSRSVSMFRRGFSLIELAIVLAIVGVLTSAIWVYADQAEESARRQQLSEQLLAIVNNIHSLYAGQANICGTFDKLTARLLTQNAIPAIMLRPHGAAACSANPSGKCVDSPWGVAVSPTNGSLAVESGIPSPPGPVATAPSAFAMPCAAASARQQFTIEVRGLPIGSCVSVATHDSAAGGPPGLQDVIINGTDIVDPATPGVTHTLPVQVADAVAKCVPPVAAGGNTIDFVYRLRAAAY